MIRLEKKSKRGGLGRKESASLSTEEAQWIVEGNRGWMPGCDRPLIREVKWDEFLPAVIRDAVQLDGRRVGSFSKYAACRIYG